MPECMFFTKHKDGKTSLGLSFSESKETDEGLCKQISTTFLDMTFFQMIKCIILNQFNDRAGKKQQIILQLIITVMRSL